MEQRPYQSTPPTSTPPKNWLVESILVTLFCCLPFGIAGIVFATQVSSKWAVGDYDGALKASKEAGKWTKVSFFVGLGMIVLSFILSALGILGSFWALGRGGYSN